MKDIQCKKCAHFTPEWCGFKMDSLDPDLMRDCEYYKVKTNADRIREMTDEELARFMSKVETNGRVFGLKGIASWLKWLKQEADE